VSRYCAIVIFIFLRVLNLLLWMVSAALCLLTLYGPFNVEADHHPMSVAESVTYNSLSRTAWSIGLGYLILACRSGRGGKDRHLVPCVILYFPVTLVGEVRASNLWHVSL